MQAEIDRLIESYNNGLESGKLLVRKYKDKFKVLGDGRFEKTKDVRYRTSNKLEVQFIGDSVLIDKTLFTIKFLNIVLPSLLNGDTYEFTHKHDIYHATSKGLICSTSDSKFYLPWQDVSRLQTELKESGYVK